jgi:nitrogen regulatory protein PII-like uncharacterized protein
MARKLFLIWEDYDGARVEQFENVEVAEDRCTVIQSICDLDENATRIHAIIQGREISMRVVETVKRVKLS